MSIDPVILEMASLYSGDATDFMFDSNEPELKHYGVGPDDNPPGRGSGRYEKGSGEAPYQHGIENFLERVDYHKRRNPGISQKELAKLCGCTNKWGEGNTTSFRIEYQKALHDWKIERAAQAQKLLDNGMTKKAVAEHFGIRDSTLTSWLNPKALERVNKAQVVADFLEKQVNEKKMIDVGSGVEKAGAMSKNEEDQVLNISKQKMAEALSILEKKGYQIFGGRVPQATNPGKKTSLSVLATPDQKWSDVYNHPELIQSVVDYTVRQDQNGEDHVTKKWQYPASMDSSRLMIRFADDVAPDGHTGLEKDGTIEIRRNVPDLDLRGSHYAQVRIMVDGNKYLKGMAHYSDNMPEGVDVIFNTNKTRDKADIVLKDIKKDPDNPFGALLRETGGQYTYVDENGNEKLGLINKTRQEGDWEEWKRTLPSQFLAKQPMELINRQLNLAISDKKAELADIMALTNPTVKKSLLSDFAEGCDADAIDMSAAALPRQKYQVILPVPTLADNEVYAPNFKDGETVALIRFPHQGLFEIPILKVNNSNPQGKELIGANPMDAIGINKANADRLSGADFDGDTVLVVPCNDPKYASPDEFIKIQNRPPLEGLEGFDPKDAYGYDTKPVKTIEKVKKKDKFGKTVYDSDGNPVYEEKEVDHYYRNGQEFKTMSKANTQMEMGKVSNLMMDATLAGAGDSDLAMIARHCQVVIDAEKHHLDWQASERDNHILELKKKYQSRVDEDGSVHTGAATLITRAGSPVRDHIKPTGNPHIDPETGKMIYTDKQMEPQTYIDKKTGKEKVRTEEVPLLSTKDSAWDLVRDPNNLKESAYAEYSDQLRAMANEARKAILATGDIEYNKQAAETYKTEVDNLLNELMLAESNSPKERMAQLYARGITLAKMRDNPDMTKKEQKKASQQGLADGRIMYGASRHKIDISPKEWEAIQSGAINKTKLTAILKYADGDKVREYATPRETIKLTTGQLSRIRNALNNGITSARLAEQYHVSVSTINRIRKEME